MLKRTLSLLLATMLLLGAMPLALAADLEPPLWQQFGYSSKEEFKEWFSYADELTDPDYDVIVAIYVRQFARAQVEGEQCWQEYGFDSKAQFMEETGLDDEQAYINFVAYEWMMDEWWQWQEAEAQREYRASLGLTRDGINVQVNGKAIAFTDAVPEQISDRTMVPLRPLSDALGGEIVYRADTDRLTVTLPDGKAISFTAGQSIALVERDGKTSSFELEIAPYEKNGRMYVYARDFADAMSMDIGWDHDLETVLIMDPATIVPALDEKFSILNRILSPEEPRDRDKTYKTVLELLATVTAFDTIDGDKTYPVSAKITVVNQGLNVDLKMQFDLSVLIDIMLEDMEPWDEADPAYAAQMKAMQQALKNGDVEMILNMDEDTVYFKSDTLMTMLLEMMPEENKIPLPTRNTWYKITDLGLLDAFTPALQAEIDAMPRTVGGLLYEERTGYRIDNAETYKQLLDNAKMLDLFVGDSRFVKSGSTYTLTIDGLAEAFAEELDAPPFVSTGEILFAKLIWNETSGKIDLSARLRIDTYSTDALYTIEVTGDRDTADMTLVLHENNAYKAEIKMKTSVKETSEKVAAAPPEGALVIDLSAMMESWMAPPATPSAEPMVPDLSLQDAPMPEAAA